MVNRHSRGYNRSSAAAARRSKNNNNQSSNDNKKNKYEDEYDDDDDEFWDELFMWLLKLLTVLSVALTTLLMYQSYMLGTIHYQGVSTVSTNVHNHNQNDASDWSIYLVDGRSQEENEVVIQSSDAAMEGVPAMNQHIITEPQIHYPNKANYNDLIPGNYEAIPQKTTITTLNDSPYEKETIVTQTPQNHKKTDTGSSGSGFQYKYYFYDEAEQSFSSSYSLSAEEQEFHKQQPPMPSNAQPSLCRDGETNGYSDYTTLKMAIDELNERYNVSKKKWDAYHTAVTEYEIILFLHYSSSASDHVKKDELVVKKPPVPPTMPPELPMPDPIQICPGATIKGKGASYYYSQQHYSLYDDNQNIHPLFYLNAPHVWIECEDCTMNSSGTHISFGPQAQNVFIRGVSFSGATTSSLLLHSHGAEVNFEDCFWSENSAIGNTGAVADLNSTSSVKFYRCEITDAKQSGARAGSNNGGFPNGFTSSLTIRN